MYVKAVHQEHTFKKTLPGQIVHNNNSTHCILTLYTLTVLIVHNNVWTDSTQHLFYTLYLYQYCTHWLYTLYTTLFGQTVTNINSTHCITTLYLYQHIDCTYCRQHHLARQYTTVTLHTVYRYCIHSLTHCIQHYMKRHYITLTVYNINCI